MVDLLACPFCGDDGEKGRQTVTQMNEARTTFDRILCRCCGAMAPELNWQSRAAIQKAAGAVPEGWRLVPINPTEKMLRAWLGEPVRTPAHEVDEYSEIRDLAYSYRAMLAAAPLPPAAQQQNPDHLDSGVCGGDARVLALCDAVFEASNQPCFGAWLVGLAGRSLTDCTEAERSAWRKASTLRHADEATGQIKIRTYCEDCGKSVSDEPDGIHTCSPQYGKPVSGSDVNKESYHG